MRRISVRIVCVLAVLLGSLAPVVRGEVSAFTERVAFDADNPFAGQWLGELNGPQLDRAFVQLVISRNDAGELEGRATVPSLLVVNAPVADLSVDDEAREISFVLKANAGTFNLTGTLSEDAQSIACTSARADAADDVDNAVTLHRYPRASDFANAGAYVGKLELPTGMAFDMAIILAQTPGGHWVGHVDIPLQQVSNYPLLQVEQNKGEAIKLAATLPGPAPGRFELALDDARTTLTGTLSQAGMSIPFEFVRDAGYVYTGMKRPQHPSPPYPYTEREFEAPHPAGHVLAGTLTIPDRETHGEGPFPGAILISGSGPQDRDETIVGHKPFLVIADYLTRRGIAVARYDDRGVGASTGRDALASATSRDFATDTEAVLDWLRTQPEVDADRIGLIGHSEGGLIAPLVAVERPDDVAFLVLLAGTGVPGRDVLILQNKLLHESMEVDPEIIAEVEAKQTVVLDKIITGDSAAEIRTAVEALLAVPSPMHRLAGDQSAAVEMALASTRSPWMLEFLTLDPRKALTEVRCPVLALNGTKDLQVWHEQNLNEIERVLRAERVDVTAKRYEGLNHLFQPAETGGVAEYASIETTFDERVLRDIAAWIRSTTGVDGDG